MQLKYWRKDDNGIAACVFVLNIWSPSVLAEKKKWERHEAFDNCLREWNMVGEGKRSGTETERTVFLLNDALVSSGLCMMLCKSWVFFVLKMKGWMGIVEVFSLISFIYIPWKVTKLQEIHYFLFPWMFVCLRNWICWSAVSIKLHNALQTLGYF